MAIPNKIDVRLHAMKAVDGIIAALKTSFAQENLLDGNNPYLFSENDPKASRLWICDPESREGFERSGGRMLITVTRGDCVPMDMHLHNRAQSSWNEEKRYSDLYQTPVMIQCEAGGKAHSEALASICAQILKFFREDLMAEFDIHEINVRSISTPLYLEGVAGEPWRTNVAVQVQTQEMYSIGTLFNQLNKLNLVQQLLKTAAAKIDTSIFPIVTISPQNTVAPVTPGSTSFTATISEQWPKPVTYEWLLVSGPGTVTFGAPTAATTGVIFSEVGSYVLQVQATDGNFVITSKTNVLVTAP